MLSTEQRVLFARQISLAEIGEQGQQALCGLAVRIGALPDDDAAGTLFRAYLTRAGLEVLEEDAATQRVVLEPGRALPSPERIAQLAGRPELEVAASFLCASFEATETLKLALGLGTGAALPALSLCAERNESP